MVPSLRNPTDEIGAEADDVLPFYADARRGKTPIPATATHVLMSAGGNELRRIRREYRGNSEA
jgi:hypothetical protein